jgi:hypothetical protein
MVFIMRTWLNALIKPKVWLSLTLGLLLITGGLYLNKSLAPTPEEVSSADFFGTRLTHNDQEWLFSGKVNYQLGSRLTQLIQAGLPLYWQFKIKRETPWLNGLWQMQLEERNYLYLIRFDAISQTYVIQNLTLNKRLEFKNLDEALNVMGYFDELEVAQMQDLPSHQQLRLTLKVQTQHWPLPLQISTFLSSLYHFKMTPVRLTLPQINNQQPLETAQ